MIATEDIVAEDQRGWLAIGWFTPDYRPLAETFAANLDQHGVPYHLFAKPALDGGWDTRRKPSVVLEAMSRYPSKTLVLMDVDCIVRGDITPVVVGDGADVGFTIKARPVSGRDRQSRKRVTLTVSSRVAVFRPTDGARAFVREWERLCDRAGAGGDEEHMVWAYLLRPDISYVQIDQRYAGREVSGDVENAIIVHNSVHDKAEQAWWSPMPALKAFERRWLRTGHTKAAMDHRIG